MVTTGSAETEVELHLQPGGRLQLAYAGEADWTVFNVYWEGVYLHNGAMDSGEQVTLAVPAGRITARFSLSESEPIVRELVVGVDETKRLEVR